MFFCNLPAITNLLLYEINIDQGFVKNGQTMNIYENFWWSGNYEEKLGKQIFWNNVNMKCKEKVIVLN